MSQSFNQITGTMVCTPRLAPSQASFKPQTAHQAEQLVRPLFEKSAQIRGLVDFIMNDNNSDFDLGLWLKWAAANAIGTPLGLVLGSVLFRLSLHVNASSESFYCVGTALFGAGIGAVVGLLQWIAVGRKHYSAGKWISASIVGSAIAWVIVFAGLLFIAMIRSDHWN